MEAEKDVASTEKQGCCHHSGKHGFCFFRLAILIGIMIVVFCIGLAFGRGGSHGYGREGFGDKRGGWGMMGGRYYQNDGNFQGCTGILRNADGTPKTNTATGTPANTNINSNK